MTKNTPKCNYLVIISHREGPLFQSMLQCYLKWGPNPPPPPPPPPPTSKKIFGNHGFPPKLQGGPCTEPADLPRKLIMHPLPTPVPPKKQKKKKTSPELSPSADKLVTGRRRSKLGRARARFARPGPHPSSSWGPPAECENCSVIRRRSSALY